MSKRPIDMSDLIKMAYDTSDLLNASSNPEFKQLFEDAQKADRELGQMFGVDSFDDILLGNVPCGKVVSAIKKRVIKTFRERLGDKIREWDLWAEFLAFIDASFGHLSGAEALAYSLDGELKIVEGFEKWLKDKGKI